MYLQFYIIFITITYVMTIDPPSQKELFNGEQITEFKLTSNKPVVKLPINLSHEPIASASQLSGTHTDIRGCIGIE